MVQPSCAREVETPAAVQSNVSEGVLLLLLPVVLLARGSRRELDGWEVLKNR